MTELKVKAVCETDEGVEVVSFGNMECDNGYWFQAPEHIDRYLLMMLFTGETDTNGEEVYSGHIIKCPKGRNDVIEFKNAGFWLKYRNVTLHHFLYTLRCEIEVIGNIHMNPELAEV